MYFGTEHAGRKFAPPSAATISSVRAKLLERSFLEKPAPPTSVTFSFNSSVFINLFDIVKAPDFYLIYFLFVVLLL